MSSHWSDENQTYFYKMLDGPRERGDGESKESSPHVSASEEDNQEAKQFLIEASRKLENIRDTPLNKPSIAKSDYDNRTSFQQFDAAESEACKDTFYTITTDSSGYDNIQSSSNIIGGLETENSTHYCISNYGLQPSVNFKLGSESVNVLEDLKSLECNPILEAPEEFRSLSDPPTYPPEERLTDKYSKDLEVKGCSISETSVREPKHCHVSATFRDDSKANIPEASNVCGRESNEDVEKNAERGIETGICADLQSLQICTISNKHIVQLRLDGTVYSNQPEVLLNTMNNDGQCDSTRKQKHVGVTCVSSSRSEHAPNGISDVTVECMGDSSGTTDEEHVGMENRERQLFCSSGATTQVAEDDSCVNDLGGKLNDTGAGAACSVDRNISSESGLVNGSGNLELNTGACAENEQTTAKASIATGVARCAEASRCSRISAATVYAGSTTTSSVSSISPQGAHESNRKLTDSPFTEYSDNDLNGNTQTSTTSSSKCRCESVVVSDNTSAKCENPVGAHLVWKFENGRLIFDSSAGYGKAPAEQDGSRPIKSTQCHSEGELSPLVLEKGTNPSGRTSSNVDNEVLSSRSLNRRTGEGRSRLKHLENKLKEAGLTDDQTHQGNLDSSQEEGKQVVDKEAVNENDLDDNQNVICSETSVKEEIVKTTDVNFIDENFCQFDVREVGLFTDLTDCNFYVVYDELEEDGNDEECEQEHCCLIADMRGDGNMGTDGERGKQHNPDRENLKSLLKKPGRGRDAKKNRVVFNENKNEFFDADYIILIREECDYDDEEDDGVCTCNEHEMVRLTCCEPNCNCNIYEGYSDGTPQSPKFAPPLEFVDAVTLSPPEGYKDMELGEQQLLALQQMARRGQRAAVCRDCSATHDDEGEGSQSDNEDNCDLQSDHEFGKEETEKTDQSQQTTPTTPPAESENTNQSQYIMETVTMTTVTERRIMREIEETKMNAPNQAAGGSPISGILKGGRLWKQHSQEVSNIKIAEQPATDSSVTSDEESNGNRRSVRFIESDENKYNNCDSAHKPKSEEESPKQEEEDEQKQPSVTCGASVSPESTEIMLTFKLGNHLMISNNSLKPNSAMRQLFPCSNPLNNKPGEPDYVHQYLVTAESLRAFEEAKKSKLTQFLQSDETDDSIKKAIERNTLRRSLIRYEPRPKKKEQKTDNSLVERIKQLTCDVDDIPESDDIPQRASPPGEEARKSPELGHTKNLDKSFSPSSSSTASSNSSSVSSTYKKITDLFSKKDKMHDVQNNALLEVNQFPSQLDPSPDLGNSGCHQAECAAHHCPVTKTNSQTESKKQFLSTLAPLTACVSGTVADDYYYRVTHHSGDRSSVTSSVGTEYSLEDINDGLKNEDEDNKRNAPDVVAGTPCASESGDELAVFVQQDASRIERIKKKYQQDNSDDDEHDDYGFNKRPSVRGIKPRFGTTTEILRQIQNQMQPPQTAPKPNPHVSWPYYSEASLSGLDNSKSRNINQNIPQYQYTYVTEEMKTKMYVQQYRPTSLMEDNVYQNCTNQRCNREVSYKANVNSHVHSPVMRCGELCHQPVVNRNRNGRPESPPPFDVARNIHQTMVYIPYNHIESYQPGCMSPNPQYQTNDKCYSRIVNQNQVNNRYIEPMYHNQVRMAHPTDEVHYQINVMKQVSKPAMRAPYPLPSSATQPHLAGSRSESPLPGQFSTARSTQTAAPTMATCNYYPMVNPRYRPAVGPVAGHPGAVYTEGLYGSKINRHSFPNMGPRYPTPDTVSLTDSESQYSTVPNGFRQSIETTFPAQKDSVPNSPTKPRFIERGVPEGAASVSPQDSTAVAQSTSTMTSPTSPQNPQPGNAKPAFYAMNV